MSVSSLPPLSLLSTLSLSPFSLALSPCLLSLCFYVASLSAFVAPFFSISLSRCQFLAFSLYDSVSPALFFSLYLFLSLSLSLSVCLSLSFVTFANSIAMSH
jgi:hypothetical protein